MDRVILANRYRLGQRVGVGGMAYVYEAEDTLLKRKVAVKILKQEFVDDEDFLKKFENEAQSAASLNHANIVNVYDVGREEVDGKLLHYIVMELVEGTTLKEIIRVQGHLSNDAIARISGQIARALQCAHEHSIIHRDIKPANILIMKSGDVKVADFGIARISSTATITYTNSILGTVHYISPEQAKGKFIDQKSDIYSLGAVMYEMATGVVPFDAENSVGIAIKHIQELPRPPIELNPGLDPGLNQIILRCLEKEPADRYPDAQALVRALADYRNIDDTRLVTSPIEATARMERVRPKNEAVYRSRKAIPEEDLEEEPPAQGRGKWIAIMVVLALFIAGGVLFALHLQNQQQIEAQKITMPSVINMDREAAIQHLESLGLSVSIDVETHSDTVPAGKVMDQSIPEKTRLDPGAHVGLTVSLGEELVRIPDLKNRTADQATEALRDAKLRVLRVEKEYAEDVEVDRITRTEPASGTEVKRGSGVVLFQSRGKEEKMAKVPSLLGLRQAQAMSDLHAAGLELGQVTPEASDTYEAGVVIRQSVQAGVTVAKNEKIDVVVSTGPQASSQSEEPKPKSSESSSSDSTTGANVRNYDLALSIPEGKEKFLLEIVDRNANATEPIFKKEMTPADAGEDGKIHITIKGTTNSDLHVYYDGQEAKLTYGD